MERFDEKSVAERMFNTQSFIVGYSINELKIYGKWLKYKKIVNYTGGIYDISIIPEDDIIKIDSDVEAELIDFASKHYGNFNYNLNYVDINKAMDGVKSNKIKLPLPLPITNNEWSTLINVENDVYRRILFIMLIDAKYYRFFNTSLTKQNSIDDSTIFYTQMSDAETLKQSGVKFNNKTDKMAIWYNLKNDTGLCDISSGKYNSRYITFVDIDKNNNNSPLDYITDYNNLMLHYQKMMGSKDVGVCEFCGKLFVQNPSKTAKFCKEHRGYKKKELETKQCERCGSSFLTKSSLSKYCNNCKKRIDTTRHKKIVI